MNTEEATRLAALGRYAILNTAPEPNFDRITKLASVIFGYPVCTLALADRDRFWFKSRQGVDATEMPRRMAFCEETIRGDDVFVVSDALADPRFVEAPVVAGAPHLRFYAGAPLITPSGSRIGSLCVLDTEPHPGLSSDQKTILADLAHTVVELLEARARQMELARCTDEIAHLARHDPLTGLPNRRRLDEVAPEAMECRHDRGALLYLDLDGFKAVNDQRGHGCGDALLQQVADRLRATVPATAHLARLGGDEFAVLLPSLADPRQEAAALAGHLGRALGQPYRIAGLSAHVGVSVGIAVFGEGEDLEPVLRRADVALYEAKANGRGRYAFARDEPEARRADAKPVEMIA